MTQCALPVFLVTSCMPEDVQVQRPRDSTHVLSRHQLDVAVLHSDDLGRMIPQPHLLSVVFCVTKSVSVGSSV